MSKNCKWIERETEQRKLKSKHIKITRTYVAEINIAYEIDLCLWASQLSTVLYCEG